MDRPEVNGTKEAAEATRAFLKQLFEKLPELPGGHTNGTTAHGEVRRTSDLFDMLQQPLSAPPPDTASPVAAPKQHPRRLVHIEIEGAEGLPKFPGRVNKKLRKKHKSHVRAVNQEPNTFVTFEAFPTAEETSVARIYATGIVEKDCNPAWHSHFSIFVLPEAENLPLKIWRRTPSVSGNHSDAQIGTALVTLLPNPSEKCDIVDSSSGQAAGKLKIRIFPARDATPLPTEDSLMSDLGPALSSLELGNVSFSRALKRKFTELEEISQRLKARLQDVTGAADDDDPDEEFEHDLNTQAEEEEEAAEGAAGDTGAAYAWLGLSEEEKRQFIHTEVTKELFVEVDGGEQSRSTDLEHIETALEQTAITEGEKSEKLAKGGGGE